MTDADTTRAARIVLATLDASIAGLMAQRAAIEMVLGIRADVPEYGTPEDDGCTHINKIELTTMGGRRSWLCPDCDVTIHDE